MANSDMTAWTSRKIRDEMFSAMWAVAYSLASSAQQRQMEWLLNELRDALAREEDQHG